MSRTFLAAAPIAAIAALFCSPLANAASPDDDYLAALSRHGITGDAATLIAAAHDTCDAMAQGYIGSGFAIWKPTSEYMGAGLSKQQADQAEFMAIDAYCPRYGH